MTNDALSILEIIQTMAEDPSGAELRLAVVVDDSCRIIAPDFGILIDCQCDRDCVHSDIAKLELPQGTYCMIHVGGTMIMSSPESDVDPSKLEELGQLCGERLKSVYSNLVELLEIWRDGFAHDGAVHDTMVKSMRQVLEWHLSTGTPHSALVTMIQEGSVLNVLCLTAEQAALDRDLHHQKRGMQTLFGIDPDSVQVKVDSDNWWALVTPGLLHDATRENAFERFALRTRFHGLMGQTFADALQLYIKQWLVGELLGLMEAMALSRAVEMKAAAVAAREAKIAMAKTDSIEHCWAIKVDEDGGYIIDSSETLGELIGLGKVSVSSPITADGVNWTLINEILDLETWFEETRDVVLKLGIDGDGEDLMVHYWNIKVKIGLQYAVDGAETVRKHLEHGRVTVDDFITADGVSWVRLGDIMDNLETYFESTRDITFNYPVFCHDEPEVPQHSDDAGPEPKVKPTAQAVAEE